MPPDDLEDAQDAPEDAPDDKDAQAPGPQRTLTVLRKKQLYGGPSPHHISLIRAYLRKVSSIPPGQAISAQGERLR